MRLQLAASALLFASFTIGPSEAASGLPSGYILQYEQSFESPGSFDEFMMTDPSAWKIVRSMGNRTLALVRKSNYEPPHRSPWNIALIKGMTFGDFVMEVDIQQTGIQGTPMKEFLRIHEEPENARGYSHRDFVFVFGFQDPSHFMYVHLAKLGDNNAHNVFVVDESPRTPITDYRNVGVEWGIEKWQRIRLVRDVSKGTITVYFNDMLTPIMIADDIPFKSGFIGFGSFDDIGWVDNIRIWAPNVTSNDSLFFD